MIKFYGYDKCSTCIKAKKLLTSKGIKFEDIDITTNPPAKDLLNQILDSGKYDLKALFNKSGQMYREMNMKDKINIMSKEELLDLLSKNGRLVKRPVISDGKQHCVGYDEKNTSMFFK